MRTLRPPGRPGRRGELTAALWQDVLTTRAQGPDVDLAYPTPRGYSHGTGGKPAMRPPVP